MNAVIYSKPACPFCDMAKKAFEANGINYSELTIGKDLVVEDFQEMYPDQKTVPLIFIDGEKIGGHTQLVEWLNNRDRSQPTFLAE